MLDFVTRLDCLGKLDLNYYRCKMPHLRSLSGFCSFDLELTSSCLLFRLNLFELSWFVADVDLLA